MARNHSGRLETVPAPLQLRTAIQMEILFRTLSRLSLGRHHWVPPMGDGNGDRCDFSRRHAKREDTDSSFGVTQRWGIGKVDFLHLPAHTGDNGRAQSG